MTHCERHRMAMTAHRLFFSSSECCPQHTDTAARYQFASRQRICFMNDNIRVFELKDTIIKIKVLLKTNKDFMPNNVESLE